MSPKCAASALIVSIVFICGMGVIDGTHAAPPASQPAGKPYGKSAPRATLDAAAPAGERFTPSASPAEAARRLDSIILNAARATKLEPTALVNDDAFLRRLSIDLIGRIPTATERRAYLADPPAERRAALVKRLLSSPDYVNRFLVFFGDILRIRDNSDVGRALRRHVVESLRANKPYDQMVRQMLVARGTLDEPAAGFLLADGANAMAMPGIVAQQFMGVRMSCAQCHDHPFDAWTQKEYYELAAYFGRTTFNFREKPYRVMWIGLAEQSSVRWPLKPETDAPVRPLAPRWPFGMTDTGVRPVRTPTARASANATDAELDDIMNAPRLPVNSALSAGMETDLAAKAQFETSDPARTELANIVTDPGNRYFAWSIVNRLWAELIGTGIVRPVDDFRSDNPPSNAALLNRLADEFVASGYDLKWIIEAITRTEAYQRRQATGMTATERAQRERLFIAAPVRRMQAEAVFDSLVTAGHLRELKHSPGHNMVELTFTVEERHLRADIAKADAAKADAGGATAATQPARQARIIPAYSAEEVDTQIADMLARDNGRGGKMEVMAMEDLEMRAAREAEMTVMASKEENYEVVTRTVTEVRDVNPRFGSAGEVPAPAPGDHMLRLFGQPSRATLGEPRDTAANTRQTLVLLNGKLVNEAARVGDLEPMARLMHASQPDTAAIELAYLEILTRPPTAREIEAAQRLIKDAGNRPEGIADLRWALLNSLEFRFVP